MTLLINNCRKWTISTVHLLRSSSVASQILLRSVSYESKRFPGYHVIYKLDSIRVISMINATKRNATILTGIIIPSTIGLSNLNFLPYSYTHSIIFAGFSISLFFHSLGFFCNNSIGFIYSKKNDADIILSYVNYWGRRVDVKTTNDSVVISHPRFMLTPFTTVKAESSGTLMKLLPNGKIIDQLEYDNFYK